MAEDTPNHQTREVEEPPEYAVSGESDPEKTTDE